MTEIDAILSMINNPTRRRILEAIAREPHYPLQLSKELGVSQQAVMKNLDLLEKNGMVVSRHEPSSMGPKRIVYRPATAFTLVVDMRGCMFTTRVNEARTEEKEEVMPRTEGLDLVRKNIAELDKEVEKLEKEISKLMEKREKIIFESMSALGPIEYAHRNLMYALLNKPLLSAEEIAEEIISDKRTIKQMLKNIEDAMKEEKEV